jgi:hypothetical protein
LSHSNCSVIIMIMIIIIIIIIIILFYFRLFDFDFSSFSFSFSLFPYLVAPSTTRLLLIYLVAPAGISSWRFIITDLRKPMPKDNSILKKRSGLILSSPLIFETYLVTLLVFWY